MKIFLTVLNYIADTIFIAKTTKGHYSVKLQMELRFSVSAHSLIVVYISTNFMKIFWMVSKLYSGHDFHQKIFKGQ